MSKGITAIAATTNAVTTQAVVDASDYEWVDLYAYGLQNTEECDIYINTVQGYVLAPNRNQDGTAKLTATITAVRLEGGLEYGVTKDATAAATGVYYALGTSRIR